MNCACAKATVSWALLLFLVRNAACYTISDRSQNAKQDTANYYGQPKREQKYYQDIYIAQLIPRVLEYGHVKETPFSWEQRFEKLNLDQNRQQGKAKWNDPKNGYGEFYYDYNHGKESGDEEDKQEEDKRQSLEDILANGRKLFEKGDVEFIDGKSFDAILNGQQTYHGGNYKLDPNGANKGNAIANERYKAYH